MIQDDFIYDTIERLLTFATVSSRKSKDSSVEILDYPARNGKILPNFDSFLPKFHFILPNFYFPLPWGIFVCSLEIPDFLGRDWNRRRCRSSSLEGLPRRENYNASAPLLSGWFIASLQNSCTFAVLIIIETR